MTLNFVSNSSGIVSAGFKFFSASYSYFEENKTVKLALVALGGVAAVFSLIKCQSPQKSMASPFFSQLDASQMAERKIQGLLACVPQKEKAKIIKFLSLLREVNLDSSSIYTLLELLGLVTEKSRSEFLKYAPCFLISRVSFLAIEECITILTILDQSSRESVMKQIKSLPLDRMSGEEKIRILIALYQLSDERNDAKIRRVNEQLLGEEGKSSSDLADRIVELLKDSTV